MSLFDEFEEYDKGARSQRFSAWQNTIRVRSEIANEVNEKWSAQASIEALEAYRSKHPDIPDEMCLRKKIHGTHYRYENYHTWKTEDSYLHGCRFRMCSRCGQLQREYEELPDEWFRVAEEEAKALIDMEQDDIDTTSEPKTSQWQAFASRIYRILSGKKE